MIHAQAGDSTDGKRKHEWLRWRRACERTYRRVALKGVKHCVAQNDVGDQGDDRHRDDEGNEISGNFVREMLNGRFGGLSVFDEPDDLLECRFLAHVRGTHDDAPVEVLSATKHLCTDGFVDRHRLARDHRFVARCRALNDAAIGGYGFARLNFKKVIPLNELSENNLLANNLSPRIQLNQKALRWLNG